MGLVLIVLEQVQQKMSLDKERHLGILLNGPVSTYQANAKTRLACIPKATRWEDTLFKENLATWRICASFELARSHKPTSCSTCRHPALHLRSRSPLSTHPFPGRANVFSKNGMKEKKSWSQPFYARILMVLPIATGKLEHTFQIGGTWIDRGFSMISMLNPPNLWHIMTYLGMAILQQVVPSLARSSGSLREVLDDPSLHCVVETSVNTESTPHSALCHPEHPRTRWPNVKWSDQNIPSVLVMFENFCSKACPWPKEAPKGPKAQNISSSPWQKHHLKHNAKKKKRATNLSELD